MESMAISEFKATCLAVLERVRRTKKPVLITRFGQPVAEVVPPSPPPPPKSWIGSMVGSAKILGDIISPVSEESDCRPAVEIVLETARFRLPHSDPADRILVATARSLGLTLVTSDARLLASKAVPTLPNR